MNFTKKQWMVLLGITLMIIVSLSFLVFRQDNSVELGEKAGKTQDTTEFEGLTIKVPGSEPNSYWELKLLKLTGLDNVGQMVGISGKYFIDQKPVHSVSAGQGEVFWKNRQLTFKDKVTFETLDGKRLLADSLTWFPERKVIRAKGNVRLETENISMKTEQLTTSADLKKASFSGMTKVITQR